MSFSPTRRAMVPIAAACDYKRAGDDDRRGERQHRDEGENRAGKVRAGRRPGHDRETRDRDAHRRPGPRAGRVARHPAKERGHGYRSSRCEQHRSPRGRRQSADRFLLLRGDRFEWLRLSPRRPSRRSWRSAPDRGPSQVLACGPTSWQAEERPMPCCGAWLGAGVKRWIESWTKRAVGASPFWRRP